jgi:diguanylate cyclase (GGDEF)-like protein/PAS domain S-box-containing protein
MPLRFWAIKGELDAYPQGFLVERFNLRLMKRGDCGDVMGHFDYCIDAKSVSIVRTKSVPRRLNAAIRKAIAAIVEIDLEGRLLFINERFAEMLGYSVQELLGTRIQDLTHPADLSRTARNIRLLTRTTQTTEMEKRYLRRDGVSVWVKVQGTVNRDEDGLPASIIAVVSDISERKNAEEAGAAKLSDLLERTTDSVLMLDKEWTVSYMTRRAGELLGCANVAGGKLWEVLPFSLGRTLRLQLKTVMEERTPFHSVRHFSTLGRWVEVNAYPSDDGISIFLRDVTDGKKHQEHIQYLEQNDRLTGLPNRLAFGQALQELGRGATGASGFAVLCLDLDQFTGLNDTFGHSTGDHVLKQVASRLRACVRSTDLVARLGNDEFAVLYLGEASSETLKGYAYRLQQALASPYPIMGRPLKFQASVGIAISDDFAHASEAFKEAEIALWCAKENGSGALRIFEPAMAVRLRSEHAIRAELGTALSKGQFENYYQPLLDLKTQKVGCFETLVRWNHPIRGLLSPGKFIHIAESSGMIADIGEWVLQQACSDFAPYPDLRVAVNVSPLQMQRALAPRIGDILSRTGLAPGQLELEITESTPLDSTHENRHILDELKATGIRVVLDDFGTGYSSLRYLQSFPFDKIKIDRSIACALPDDLKARAIVDSIVGLGRALGTSITAEGVETEEQLEALRQLGCDEVQGYLLGRPAPFRHLDFGAAPAQTRSAELREHDDLVRVTA